MSEMLEKRAVDRARTVRLLLEGGASIRALHCRPKRAYWRRVRGWLRHEIDRLGGYGGRLSRRLELTQDIYGACDEFVFSEVVKLMNDESRRVGVRPKWIMLAPAMHAYDIMVRFHAQDFLRRTGLYTEHRKKLRGVRSMRREFQSVGSLEDDDFYKGLAPAQKRAIGAVHASHRHLGYKIDSLQGVLEHHDALASLSSDAVGAGVPLLVDVSGLLFDELEWAAPVQSQWFTQDREKRTRQWTKWMGRRMWGCFHYAQGIPSSGAWGRDFTLMLQGLSEIGGMRETEIFQRLNSLGRVYLRRVSRRQELAWSWVGQLFDIVAPAAYTSATVLGRSRMRTATKIEGSKRQVFVSQVDRVAVGFVRALVREFGGDEKPNWAAGYLDAVGWLDITAMRFQQQGWRSMVAGDFGDLDIVMDSAEGRSEDLNRFPVRVLQGLLGEQVVAEVFSLPEKLERFRRVVWDYAERGHAAVGPGLAKVATRRLDAIWTLYRPARHSSGRTADSEILQSQVWPAVDTLGPAMRNLNMVKALARTFRDEEK